MKQKKYQIMFVSPEFHKVIKTNACMNNMKIIEYTKKLAPNFEELIIKKKDLEKKVKKNAEKYEFKF